jgi:glycosyltransferase involved in cell wall biosynthesis
LRVLFVTHAFPRYDGDVAGAFVLRLARALADAGTAVDVLAPSAPGLAATATVEGIPVRRFRYAPEYWETLAYSGTMAEQVRASAAGKLALAALVVRGSSALRAAIAEKKPDVVHAHWWFPSGLLASGRSMRRPMVTTLHGSDVRLARTTRWAPSLFRGVAHRSACVTAVSSWLATEAQAMAPRLPVSVEPMPVNIDLFSPGGVRHAARFLFVGRLNAQKGIALLLDALAVTTKGAALDVVGDGPERDALGARAAALGIAPRVIFHGALPQDRLVPFYRAATAVVVPSENEGLGLVAVEAQLCETPVIAFRSGGLVDVVIDGETGLLAPTGDFRALADAMDALLRRDDRGALLGRAGRDKALARFAPAAVAARYRAVYERALTHAR